jgi:succinate dehydrogenase/fumarate reductase flavoprotein subunit
MSRTEKRASISSAAIDRDVDGLVIGGGPAGTWAAIAAASGAQVVPQAEAGAAASEQAVVTGRCWVCGSEIERHGGSE